MVKQFLLNPDGSIPSGANLEKLASQGIPLVVPTIAAKAAGMIAVEQDPQKDENGVFRQVWVLVPAQEQVTTPETQEEAELRIRSQRDDLLTQSDWIVVVSYERNEPVNSEWASYRQALRDIPTQQGFPHEVIWPNKPE